jgi:hypothetical protein
MKTTLVLEVQNVPASEPAMVITSQILKSALDHYRLAILDEAGSYYVMTIDPKGEKVTAKCFNTGKLFGEERKLSSASISPEGIITALGELGSTILTVASCKGY